MPQQSSVDTTWRPRATARRQQQRSDGRHVVGLGLRIGYWPCLRAPFVRFDIAHYIFEVWVGWRSYIDFANPAPTPRTVRRTNASR